MCLLPRRDVTKRVGHRHRSSACGKRDRRASPGSEMVTQACRGGEIQVPGDGRKLPIVNQQDACNRFGLVVDEPAAGAIVHTRDARMKRVFRASKRRDGRVVRSRIAQEERQVDGAHEATDLIETAAARRHGFQREVMLKRQRAHLVGWQRHQQVPGLAATAQPLHERLDCWHDSVTDPVFIDIVAASGVARTFPVNGPVRTNDR